MRALFLGTIFLLLSGCFGETGTRLSPASYDLSSPPMGSDSGQAGMVGQIEVLSPSWLDTTAMQYRLAYADRARREIYAGSRWVAPPAKLLEQQLKRRLLGGVGAVRIQPAGCRLSVELDEFVQVFDAPEMSRVIIEARAALLAPRAATFLARQRFTVIKTASADARSGAVALDAAARQFGEEIEDWLRQGATEIFDRCRLG